MARSISALGKPILSIFAIAESRCAPRVRADGPLKFPSSVPVAAAGTGDGVAGAFGVVLDAGAGAAGGTGVEAGIGGGAGVEGALAEEAAEELAGAALGYSPRSEHRYTC